MNRKIVLFMLCVMLMSCCLVYAQQIPVSDALYTEVVNGTILPYFSALKDGNVTAIKMYIAGNLYEKYKVLLEQNKEYPAYLRKYYQGAVFHAGKAEMSDNDVTVEIVREFPDGRRNQGRLTLSKENLVTEFEKLTQLIELSYNVLKYQMTYPLEQEIRVSGNLEQELENILITADQPIESIDYDKRPEYTVLEQAIALDEVDIKRLKNGYLPTLKAFAFASEAIQRDKLFDGSESSLIPTVSVGLGLSVPIFDGREKASQIQRVKLDLQICIVLPVPELSAAQV